MAYFPKTPIIEIAKSAKVIDDDYVLKVEEGMDNMMISVESIITEGRMKINSNEVIDAYSQTKLIAQFASVMYLIPILPKRIGNFMLKKKLYRKIPKALFNIIKNFAYFYRSFKEGVRSPRKIIRYYKTKKKLKKTYSNYL
jgi:hypothetical protein